MALDTRQFNEEVLFTKSDLTMIGHGEIQFLKEKAKCTKRQRIRLCIHKNPEETVHEMIIVLSGGSYVRPHKHVRKHESFHIIEGKGDVFLYTDEGEVKQVIRLGGYRDKSNFYCRIPTGICHSLVPVSDWLVFIETTIGPFIARDTIYPAWAPKEEDAVAVNGFMKNILKERQYEL